MGREQQLWQVKHCARLVVSKQGEKHKPQSVTDPSGADYPPHHLLSVGEARYCPHHMHWALRLSSATRGSARVFLMAAMQHPLSDTRNLVGVPSNCSEHVGRKVSNLRISKFVFERMALPRTMIESMLMYWFPIRNLNN